MSEVEREDQSQGDIVLPIEWHVPDTIHNQYVQNVLVQPGKYEITLFFFETRLPLATSTTPAPKLRELRLGDAKEADDEIAWAAYKRIEPRYSRTNRMLADM